MDLTFIVLEFLFLVKHQNAMSLAKQREYLRHYEIHLTQMVGVEKARETMKDALYIISMGTNDFLQNYFVELVRSKQYTVEQYQDFLIRSLVTHVKVPSVSLPSNACSKDEVYMFFFFLIIFVHQHKYQVIIYSSTYQNLDI